MATRFFPLRYIAIAMTLLLYWPPKAANAQDPLPPEIIKALVDWSACRTARIAGIMSPNLEADFIVDKALKECSNFEAETIRVWEKVYGHGTGRQVFALKQKSRIALIDLVNSTRNHSEVSSPFGSWGKCVGDNIPQDIPDDASSASIADTAFSACQDRLEKIREGMVA